MIAGQALFYSLAVALVLTALGMVMARNVVHAALLMVAHFLMTAVIYVMLQASFVAVVQVAVYAGAIMVLFLFVVMLLGNQRATLEEHIAGQRPLGIALVALLAGLLVFVVRDGVPAAGPRGPGAGVGQALELPPEFGSAEAIADLLFRDYVLPLEIVSALLLVAMLGAVVVARARRSDAAWVSATSTGAAAPGSEAEASGSDDARSGTAGPTDDATGPTDDATGPTDDATGPTDDAAGPTDGETGSDDGAASDAASLGAEDGA